MTQEQRGWYLCHGLGVFEMCAHLPCLHPSTWLPRRIATAGKHFICYIVTKEFSLKVRDWQWCADLCEDGWEAWVSVKTEDGYTPADFAALAGSKLCAVAEQTGAAETTGPCPEDIVEAGAGKAELEASEDQAAPLPSKVRCVLCSARLCRALSTGRRWLAGQSFGAATGNDFASYA